MYASGSGSYLDIFVPIEKYVVEWVVNLKSISNIDLFPNFFETLIKR
jgi:hypothetical protein